MEIENGNVVVIRNGDFVECVFYRKFYKSLKSFIYEIRYFLEEHKYSEPNISYMKIEDKHFVPVTSGSFKNEFSKLLEEFDLPSSIKPYCEHCGSCNFVYLEEEKYYCPSCKKFTEIEY